ncbi:MAG: type II secretion system F family protein [Nanoarchaeota archaeon]|nr:type II secretion system F family protein [Nanoarchaeota archaeon]
MKQLLRTIAKIVPRKVRIKVRTNLDFTTIKANVDYLIGGVLVLSVLFGVLFGFLLSLFFNYPWWLFSSGSFVVLLGLAYVYLMLAIDKKAARIEESLPDALQLMASNLRAGMTPDKALLLSARPEFGILKDEIDLVGRKVAMGTSIGFALMEMTTRVKLKRLSRAVELINSGLDSGGSLAMLLEMTANNLQDQFLIDKKIKASITMYVIFIFSAAAVITPFLFGLSSFLIDILKNSLSQIEIPTGASTMMPIKIAEIKISAEFLTGFIITFLSVNGLMASMLLGQIAKGKKRAGLSYFIPLILLAIPLFLLARYLIKSLIGGLFNF